MVQGFFLFLFSTTMKMQGVIYFVKMKQSVVKPDNRVKKDQRSD